MLQARGEIDSKKQEKFDLAKNSKLVAPFNEQDPDNYFRTLEKTANHLKWPKEQWTWLLQTKLVGKAAIAYNNLDRNEDYDHVKETILAAYSITVEGYRQAFRRMNKSSNITYNEFASDKLRAFDKWIKVAEVETFEQLRNLILLEEFKRKIPNNVMLHIEDKHETDLVKAARLADVYSLVHKSFSVEKKRTQYDVKTSLDHNLGTQNKQISNPTTSQSSPLFCNFCKKEGHSIKQCKHPNCKYSQQSQSSSRQFTQPMSKYDSHSKPVSNICKVVSKEDLFKDFRFKGTIALSQNGKPVSVNILRDTGAVQTLLVKKAVPGLSKNYTGEKVFIRFFHYILNSACTSIFGL